MSKIYLVMSQCGEYEDYYECVEKAFTDVKKAEAYLLEKESSEETYRWLANKCRDCDAGDKTCPYYIPPTHKFDPCENYEPYHDNVNFRIEEVEIEE